jgi:ATP-dependent DNA helicase RecG
MINPIEHIIQEGENDTVEFKRSFSDEVMISLVAFANAKGGTVYLGIEDDGTVKGVSLQKETLQKWINEVKNKTAPSIIPDAEQIEID